MIIFEVIAKWPDGRVISRDLIVAQNGGFDRSYSNVGGLIDDNVVVMGYSFMTRLGEKKE